MSALSHRPDGGLHLPVSKTSPKSPEWLQHAVPADLPLACKPTCDHGHLPSKLLRNVSGPSVSFTPRDRTLGTVTEQSIQLLYQNHSMVMSAVSWDSAWSPGVLGNHEVGTVRDSCWSTPHPYSLLCEAHILSPAGHQWSQNVTAGDFIPVPSTVGRTGLTLGL